MTLPTPPTLEQRLDAAAELWRRTHFPAGDRRVEAYAELTENEHRTWRKYVEPLCKVFAPELFGEEGQ